MASPSENYINTQVLPIENLEEALKADKRNCEEEDEQNMWYHGKMTRDAAEKILFDAIRHNPGLDSNGIFLVRDSTASSVDMSLSILFNMKCMHFYIKRMNEGFYCIDGGPTIQGLEKLIEHLMEVPNTLPTRLTKLCMGKAPPAYVRKTGPTNILHKTVREGNVKLLKKILCHPLCPEVRAKNAEGSTALHDAAIKEGFEQGVELLLAHGAVINDKDANGDTALHKACASNLPSICELLISHDMACVQERSSTTSQVPLHIAAMHGHLKCLKVLLNSGAAVLPRGENDVTPIELAEQYRRKDCIKYLQHFKVPEPVMKKEDWFHVGMDRQTTVQLLHERGLYNGLFMVSKSGVDHYRLSVCDKETVKHFKIVVTEYRGQRAYYIDFGPYHLSLESLVDYYNKFQDYCPATLKYPVFAGESPTRAKTSELPPKPVPPRPVISLPQPDAHKPLQQQKSSDSNSKKGDKSPATPTESLQQSLEEIQGLRVIKLKQLKKGKEIGTGEYGSVLKGVLIEKKKFLGKGGEIQVAIKTFHNVGNLEDFNQEANVMQSLKHEYIVELLGVCHGPPLMLVEEFVPMGSMLNVLEEQRKKIRVKQELYLWAAQIAEGMMFLETKRLVHRDLAARNILMVNLQHVKISDFGLSRMMGTDKEYYKASKGGRWPIKWYAPESVNYGHFSHASDVWSYGVTLWEMFSFGDAPYENMTGFEVVKFVEDGQRLSRPEQCPPGVYDVMLRCWQAKPADRPTFQELSRHFDSEPEYASAQELKRLSRMK